MKTITAALIASAVVLSACGGSNSAPPPAPSDPITQQLVGKVLQGTDLTLRLQEGNRLAGSAGSGTATVPIDGAWEIRDGRFCRTLSAPSQLAGTECQDIVIEGETATLQTRNGPRTFIISDS